MDKYDKVITYDKVVFSTAYNVIFSLKLFFSIRLMLIKKLK